jgi:hypothetical protein
MNDILTIDADFYDDRINKEDAKGDGITPFFKIPDTRTESSCQALQ